jgi:septum formation protein
MRTATPHSTLPVPPLLLASASPRRQELLRTLGITAIIEATEIDEDIRPGETPDAAVRRLAESKGLVAHRRNPEALVLAADTVVVLDGSDGARPFGKPRDVTEAAAMLQELSGREHRVLTGIALHSPGGAVVTDVAETRVKFAPLSPGVVDWYLRTGEALDKAGAYGVQGAAALFIDRIEGSWTNVVGLPLERLPALFTAAGFDLTAFLGPQPR